jgi:hypothetical protein
MAIKGPLWLMAKCLEEERSRGKLTFLSGRALDLGIRKSESTRGHIFQACGAVQAFFEDFPNHIATVKNSSPVEPFKPTARILRDWLSFIDTKSGSYSQRKFNYNYDTVKNYLTPKYGGIRHGGGGGDNEFEIALRLVAEFLP